jgi:2-polyprenyl-6-methoxyphenol hydroxylase-like FAD-dependent oxidoreductase
VRTAIVVGAGVGGLAAAGALARTGWHVTLLERGERLRGNGAALLIWPNGVAALQALGLSLGDIAFPMLGGGIRRPDGRWLVEASPAAMQPSQADPVVVHSDDLHDTLMAGLGESLEIRTGTEVTTVRVGTAQRPAIGTGKQTFEADLIVAADGSRSLIRRRLAAQSNLASAGYTAWRAVIPWYRAPKLPETVPAAGEMLGAGQRFLYASLGERGTSGGSSRGGIYWAATAPGALRPEPPRSQLALLRRWFADWQSPVTELLDATEPDDLVQQAGEELRPLPRRFGFPTGSGGFVLLGDAAHVSTPVLTQGACLAFEDAATLRALVSSAEPGPVLHAALDGYTMARRTRVARIGRTSRRLGLVLQAQGRFTIRARDAALGRLPPRLLDRASASSLKWTPPTPAP